MRFEAQRAAEEERRRREMVREEFYKENLKKGFQVNQKLVAKMSVVSACFVFTYPDELERASSFRSWPRGRW